VTDWSIWPATNGPNTDAGDSSDISRGVIFRLSSPGWLKAIRFYRGTTNVGAWTGGAPIGRLYTLVDGLPVSATDVTFTPGVLTGWIQADLPVPKPLAANVSYKAAVITGNYTATGGYFASGAGVGGIVNGILTCPDAGGNPSGIGPIQQMSFKQPTTGLEFPNQYFNGGNYWVDVVVADTDPGTDIRDVAGSLTVSADVLATMDGKIGIADSSLPVTLNTTAVFDKSVGFAPGLPVQVGLSSVDEKISDSTPSLPVSVTLSALVESVGAGVHAPVSEVLCSSWANFVDVPTRLRDRLPTLTETDWQANLMLASELLWMMSGRRWYGGGCTETAVLRSWPPQQGRGDWPYSRSWGNCACWSWATWMDGMPFPGDYRGQHATQPYAIQLPRSPITNIVSVTIDGNAFTEYEMLRNGWIERTDGQLWQTCDGNTTVVYQYGEPPPLGGKQAAIALAFEIGLEQIGDGECRLPSLVTSITRQGVTITRQTATDFQEVQRTGLPEVDRWLAAVNPESRASRAVVWSPDLPSAVRTPQ
jgi:Domain of unknown function (DUF4082)